MYIYIRETRGETRTTERQRKNVNLAYLAEHWISKLLSADLVLIFKYVVLRPGILFFKFYYWNSFV